MPAIQTGISASLYSQTFLPHMFLVRLSFLLILFIAPPGTIDNHIDKHLQHLTLLCALLYF